MDIKNIEDIKKVVEEMHDSEFNGQDFNFDVNKRVFYLKSRSAEKEFNLQLCNVEKYNPFNLDKINMKRGVAGVFNDIKVQDKGLTLEVLSQDLKILLELSKLEGKLEIISIK